MSSGTCVYTALTGGYERLNEQPAARRSDLEFLCLTDDPGLVSETWRIVPVEPAWPTDPVRSARALKIRGHPALDAYDHTIWIDNCVLLREDPAFLLDTTGDAPVAALDHPWHDDVLSEFLAVLDQGLDDPARVNEQLMAYLLSVPEVLEQRPFATGVMVRHRSPDLEGAMRVWLDHVLRFSRRDQLSFNTALAVTGIAAARLPGDPSQPGGWASWPHPSHRSLGSRIRTKGFTLPAPALVRDALDREAEALAMVARTEAELVVVETRLEAAAAFRREDAAALSALGERNVGLQEDRARLDWERGAAEAAVAEAEARARRAEDAATRAEAARAAAEESARVATAEIAALRASRSWTGTAPLRRMTDRRRKPGVTGG